MNVFKSITEPLSKNMVCHYCAGPTSSNKTGLAIDYAAKRYLAGKKTLIVAPSIEMLEEYKSRGESKYPSVTFETCHSKNRSADTPASVKVDVERTLNNLSTFRGRIMCITHSTFQKLSATGTWKSWNVIIDEALEVFEPHEKNLHNSHKIITDALKVTPEGPFYSRISVSDPALLMKIAENRDHDILYKELSELAKRLLNQNYDSFTPTAKYQKLLSKGGKCKKLIVNSVLSSRGIERFGTVMVLSARFQESIHYQIWQHEGVRWIEDKEMTKRLRIQRHTGYDRLRIFYGYEGGFSKHYRNNNPESYESLIHRAVATMGGEKFIRLENNDIRDISTLSKQIDGELIPGRSNGLNTFKDIHHAIVIPALHYPPQATKFLERHYQIDRNAQSIGFARHALYQALSRTSMRDGDLSKERRWVVPTIHDARWLSSVFEGSSIVSLGLNNQPAAGKRGRPKQFIDANARKAKNKKVMRNVVRQSRDFEDRIADNIMKDVIFIDPKGDVVNTLITKGNIVADFRATLFNHRFDKQPSYILTKRNKFRSYLKYQSTNEYANKHDVSLISPAFYNPFLSHKTKRGRENTVFASCIMLDFDGTDIRPSNLAEMFPGLSFVCYNTFSNRPNDLRYRMYIETTRPILIEEYMIITKALVTVMEDEGYIEKPKTSSIRDRDINIKYHGVDKSKLGPYALFYLPCRAGDKSEGSSFFKAFSDANRSPLDVNEWLSNLPGIANEKVLSKASYKASPVFTSDIDETQKRGLEEAMNEWYRYGVLPGKGCEGIRTLYGKLCRLQLPPEMRNDHLFLAASSANSPEDRKKQVQGFIKSYQEFGFTRLNTSNGVMPNM